MERMQLFHGTTGDNILSILSGGRIIPKGGKVFFSRFQWDTVFQYGADSKRKAAFAIKVEIELSDEVKKYFKETMGNRATLELNTTSGVPARVLELYVRPAGGGRIETITGGSAIRSFLNK